MKQSRILLICILLLCVAGAWISGDLVRQHAGDGGSLLARICHATTGTGCSAAIESRWSSVTIPVPIPTRDFSTLVRRVRIPVAFMGLAYFVFMGVWFAMLGGPRRFGRPWHLLPLHVGYVSLAFSLMFTGLMAVGAAPLCVLCLAVHAINTLLVAATWRLVSGRAAIAADTPVSSAHEQLARVTLTSREVATTLAVVSAVVSGLWLYRGESLVHRKEQLRLRPFETMVTSLQRDSDFLQREFLTQQHREIPLRETETADNDRPRLVVFTDFQCPACYCNDQLIRDSIVGVFDGTIDVHVRHYPLCSDCNDDVAGPGHPQACEAARVAEAARLLGGEDAFRRMSELLFARQGKLGPGVYRELAREIGLDPALLAAEAASDAVHQTVRDDIALARVFGVTGTPAMYLDGRPVSELLHTPTFWRAYARTHTRAADVEIADAASTENMP